MFDVKAAKALAAGEHIVVDGAPGLRLEATEQFRTWVYRYRSPVDDRMRQIKLGRWPAMGLPAALAKWQEQKDRRDAGGGTVQPLRCYPAGVSVEFKLGVLLRVIVHPHHDHAALRREALGHALQRVEKVLVSTAAAAVSSHSNMHRPVPRHLLQRFAQFFHGHRSRS
jgi:hypothetical protein